MESAYQNKKRASNMVWTAAGQYDIAPLYLFYYEDGSPALYPNTIEGLGYTCLDQEALLPLLEGIEAGHETLKFRTLALLILEETVYERQKELRPGLAELRLEYAAARKKELRAPERYEPLGWERQELIWCYQKLGIDTGCFSQRELELAAALKSCAHLAADHEIASGMKSAFWHFYFYHFTKSRKSETIDFVGAGLFMALVARLMGTQFRFRLADDEDASGEAGNSDNNEDGSGEDGSGADGSDAGGSRDAAKTRAQKLLTLFKHLLSQTTELEDLIFIEDTFGPCMYSGPQLRQLQDLYCRGYHKKSKLWYVGQEEGKNALDQMHRNLKFYQEGHRQYERSIRHITDHLKHALEEQLEPDSVPSESGRLDGSRVYRIRAMHDLKVFRREIAFPDPDFTVDLILDASNSRHREQEAIAVQAYIITRSLMNLEIPVQVSCFRSLRGFTVLQRLKSYEMTDSADDIFRYFCTGNNRDGLALQALHPFLEEQGTDACLGKEMSKKKRILLVLTDALPSDTQKAYIPGTLRQGTDYDEMLAADDTREAVLRYRREGCQVAAIFWGEKFAVPRLKHIYGDNYISIHAISQLPDAVIGLLLQILSRLQDHEQS